MTNSKMEYERVGKLEAAQRQLETAVKLHFDYSDTISIHTLTCAAHQILEDLWNIKKPPKLTLLDFTEFREEYRGEIRKAFRKPQNFFKHAKNDPEAILQFPLMLTQMYLLDAIFIHNSIVGKQFYEGAVYWVWFNLKYSDMLLIETVKTITLELKGEGMSPDKYSFFSEVIRDNKIKIKFETTGRLI